MSKDQVEAEFTKELKALLAKWGAELEADDYFVGYAECGEDIRMKVTVTGIYNYNGDTVREFTEIDLGRWVKP